MVGEILVEENMLILPKYFMLMGTDEETERVFVPSSIEQLKNEDGKTKIAFLGGRYNIELTHSEYDEIRGSGHVVEDIDMYLEDPKDWAVCKVVLK